MTGRGSLSGFEYPSVLHDADDAIVFGHGRAGVPRSGRVAHVRPDPAEARAAHRIDARKDAADECFVDDADGGRVLGQIALVELAAGHHRHANGREVVRVQHGHRQALVLACRQRDRRGGTPERRRGRGLPDARRPHAGDGSEPLEQLAVGPIQPRRRARNVALVAAARLHRHDQHAVARRAKAVAAHPAEAADEQPRANQQDQGERDLSSREDLHRPRRAVGAAAGTAKVPQPAPDVHTRGPPCGGQTEDDAGDHRHSGGEREDAEVRVEIEHDRRPAG